MAKLNLSPCTLKQVKGNLLLYYENAVKAGLPFRELDAVFLWSTPGIGKSDMAKQTAAELSLRTGRRTRVCEVRLAECTLLELLGLMHRDPETGTVKYDAPPIYGVQDPSEIVIYLFDELDKASRQLQAAALHLVLDRKFWQYELPENSLVIAAGNPENIEGEMYSRLAPELNNRFRHYLLTADYPAWESWALAEGVHPSVIRFLGANPHLLSAEDGGEGQAAFRTPRSWARVSSYLKLMFGRAPIDWDIAWTDVSGYIGTESALVFQNFCMNEGKLPRPEDILSGKHTAVPAKADQKDAVMKGLISYIGSHRKELGRLQWAFAREYMESFPEEYPLVFYRNLASTGLFRDMYALMTDREKMSFRRHFGDSIKPGGDLP